MRGGSPECRLTRVTQGGSSDQRIRTEHNVLYTSNARREGEGINLEVTYCIETPSKEICGWCIYDKNCNFKKID